MAKNQLKRFLGVPEDDPSSDLYRELETLSDHAVILVGTSYIAHELGVTTRELSMPGLSGAEQAVLFDDVSAPLSSFSARIKVAKALGIIGGAAARELDILRNVRNTFAHSGFTLTFAKAEVATEILKLEPAIDRHPAANVIRTVLPDSPLPFPRQLVLWTVVWFRTALAEKRSKPVANITYTPFPDAFLEGKPGSSF